MQRSLCILTALWLIQPIAILFAAEEPAKKPNILFILADDLGWGDLACYGNQVMHTPHLDALAKQSMRLTQCYSACPVCSPSRSAILTGRTPHRNGVYTWIAEGSEVHLRRSEVALPKLLQGAGYDTCHVGKWHLNGKFNSPEQPQPNDHGYNWWMATQNNAAPSHKNPVNFVRNGQPMGPQEGYSAVLVADEAARWLREERDPAKPFFLSVWTHEPHLPIESDPQFQKHYEQEPDVDVRQHHGNVTQLDFACGKLLAVLDELKLAENTMVIFTADNGPEGDGTKGRTRGSTGGLRGRKRDVYEGGIRVPGIVRWPGHVQPGTESATPIIGSDWFSTLLTVAGVAIPQDRVLDGVNVLPVVTGEVANVTRKVPLYWRLEMANSNRHMAMRSGDWKLVASRNFEIVEMFNIARDGQEQHDLREQEPERFATLLAQFKALHAEIEAEGPDWWKRLGNNGGKPLKPMQETKKKRKEQ